MTTVKKKKQKLHSKVKEKVVYVVSEKSKIVAALLAFFLGDLGIHKFYLGQNKQGVIYLLLTLIFSWTFIVPVIITIICWMEALGYITTDDKEFAKVYR